MTNGVYSEFECDAQQIQKKGDSTSSAVNCIGTVKESAETKTITKKCRGAVIKKKTKIIGMSIEETVHIPYDVYLGLVAMEDDDLVDGVSAVSSTAKFPEFALTQRIIDEDDAIKYKLYPNCVLTEKPEVNIDNSSEEVAEVTLKMDCSADEYGKFCYEALADELTDGQKKAWMTTFKPDDYHKVKKA